MPLSNTNKLDIVLRHRLGLGVLNGKTQTRVRIRIGIAHLRSDGNFLGQLGKHLRPGRVLATFAVHDVLEF